MKKHNKNDRVYNFIGILYEDDENFDTQYFNLLQEKNVIYARHDNDFWESDQFEEDGVTIKYHSGDLKKPHIHYVVKLKNATTLSAFAKRLGVKENSVEYVEKSLNSCITYLIHFKLDNKYQYETDIVKSNSDDLLRRFFDLVEKDTPEVEKVSYIQDYIENCNDFVDLGILGRYVQKNNMWDAFRRNMMYFIKIVDNHNAKISAKYYKIDNPYYDSDY